jgi:endothelin-converting enzyme
MSGQKYKRTNFEEDDNMSTGGTPPGVTYDPSIAFKAGASFWQKRTILEKLLICLSATLAIVVIILGVIVGTQRPPVPAPAPVEKKTGLSEDL